MFGINAGEVLLLTLIAIIVLGPQRMPEYAAKLARGIRQLRVMAEGAKGQLKEQLGPEYDDIDWHQYDPRQYDPRRIVREALIEPLEDATSGVTDLGVMRPAPAAKSAAVAAAVSTASAASADAEPVDLTSYDPTRPTPFDTDAT